jgi:hypothetical protein
MEEGKEISKEGANGRNRASIPELTEVNAKKRSWIFLR